MKKLIPFILFLFITISSYCQNYYPKTVGELSILSTWGTNINGTGSSPTSFTNPSYVFNITNTNNTVNYAWNVSNVTLNTSNGLILNANTIITGILILTNG